VIKEYDFDDSGQVKKETRTDKSRQRKAKPPDKDGKLEGITKTYYESG
jgi:antitoxin component YwqK of YwqJK toxin-antitoxin module